MDYNTTNYFFQNLVSLVLENRLIAAVLWIVFMYFILRKIAKKDNNKFLDFWKNFGAVIKEGLYEFNDHHEKILNLLRFENSLNSDSISLDSYVEKMALDQKEIYYFANTDKEYIKNSPQLESFLDKKIPVLFMTDRLQ